MLLVLEIIATVRAWKAGWGWKVLIPWAVFMGCAFFIGAAMGANGTNVSSGSVLAVSVIFDLLNVITLFTMAANGPSRQDVPLVPEEQSAAVEAPATPSRYEDGDLVSLKL